MNVARSCSVLKGTVIDKPKQSDDEDGTPKLIDIKPPEDPEASLSIDLLNVHKVKVEVLSVSGPKFEYKVGPSVKVDFGKMATVHDFCWKLSLKTAYAPLPPNVPHRCPHWHSGLRCCE